MFANVDKMPSMQTDYRAEALAGLLRWKEAVSAEMAQVNAALEALQAASPAAHGGVTEQSATGSLPAPAPETKERPFVVLPLPIAETPTQTPARPGREALERLSDTQKRQIDGLIHEYRHGNAAAPGEIAELAGVPVENWADVARAVMDGWTRWQAQRAASEEARFAEVNRRRLANMIPGTALAETYAIFNEARETVWTAQTLNDALRERGFTSDAENPVNAVRGTLSRLFKGGYIAQVERGRYRWTEPPAGHAENDTPNVRVPGVVDAGDQEETLEGAERVTAREDDDQRGVGLVAGRTTEP